MAAAAIVIACRPEAQARVTVMRLAPTAAGAGRARSRAPTLGARAGQDHAAPDDAVDLLARDAGALEQRADRGDAERDGVDA